MGGWDADEDGVGGSKTRREKGKRYPLPTLQSQASSYPLFDLEGSAICDLLFELFLKGRVSPFKDSTGTIKDCQSIALEIWLA